MKVIIKSKWINGTQMKDKELDLSKEELKYLDDNNIKYEVKEVKEVKKKDADDKV